VEARILNIGIEKTVVLRAPGANSPVSRAPNQAPNLHWDLRWDA